MNKCPGQDRRLLSTSDIVCPHCGASVEFFSDEQKRKCPSCGVRVTREEVVSCANWCSSARTCLGAARYDELVKKGDLVLPSKDEPE